MQLNGSQSERLSECLRNAFTPQTLQRMLLYRLDKQLFNYAAPGDFPQVVFELIEAANREEWVDELIIRAREAVPKNARLLAFTQQFGLASTAASRQELQRIIDETNPLLDVAVFRERLGELEPRVCRLEIASNKGRIYGTGFLLGPSVVITNHHVIEPVLEGEQGRATADGIKAKRGDVTVRFDYKRMLDGSGAVVRKSEGRTYGLATEWLIDSSPNSPPDQLAPHDHLDYALLLLDGAAGDETIGRGAEPGGVKRGFIPLTADAHTFAQGSSLFILQHPRGAPLKLALETKSVLGLNENGTRIRYTTNTERGSSGSPCFSPDWELIALHHSGDPDFDLAHKPTYNEGIPMSAILTLLSTRGHAKKLGAQEGD